MYNDHKHEGDLMDKYRSMIEEYNEENGIDDAFITLSDKQTQALEMFKNGENVLVIGSAGTGKSRLIQEMRYVTEKTGNKRIAVCATTGIAAYNIGGVTINSYMGIGTGEHDVETLISRVERKRGMRERIRLTDIMIIDEISMMSGELFEKINAVCQALRRSTRPFGGMQVVLVGDFYQLTPVFKRNTTLYATEDTRLLFESETFTKYFSPSNTVLLTSNYRQADPVFVELLMRVRKGEHTEADMNVLRGRMTTVIKPKREELDRAVYLVSANKHARVINLNNLKQIKSMTQKYIASFEMKGDERITSELKNELVAQFTQKGIMETELKKGARVMLIKNLSVEQGLVNGSVGTIQDFKSKYPVVKFDNGVTETITPVEWELDMKDSIVRGRQVPLMLCWACTIHRVQGVTLDKAVVDLGDVFCDHMVYVALSRVKTLDGLYIGSFNPDKITVNVKVKKYTTPNS